MKNTGILRIQAFGARQSSPIEGVLVTVSGNGFTAQRITCLLYTSPSPRDCS